MHKPEHSGLPPNSPENQVLTELFDTEEKRLKDLREEYGDDHVMKIFRPKKRDYLKPPKR